MDKLLQNFELFGNKMVDLGLHGKVAGGIFSTPSDGSSFLLSLFVLRLTLWSFNLFGEDTAIDARACIILHLLGL